MAGRTYVKNKFLLAICRLRKQHADQSGREAQTLRSGLRIALEARISTCVHSSRVVLCAGSGLASGCSSVQGVLPTVYKTPWSESASQLYRPSDRHLSAKLMPTFADRGCHVISVADPHGRILDFLDWRRYFFFQVTPQLYSRGWVDPVPDPLLLSKYGSAGNRTRTAGLPTVYRIQKLKQFCQGQQWSVELFMENIKYTGSI
jgi:hypothetical protein